MSAAEQATSPAAGARIDPGTQVGVVALTVADLGRSVAFYSEALGFAVLAREAGSAVLGAGGMPLIVLAEEAGARPWVVRATGLYHFAILVPSRGDLGRWLRHWLTSGHPMPGQADHLVSEALYLNDPDGNGIEIYRDRPRAEWRWDGGQVRMAVDPLDIPGLLDEGDAGDVAWAGMPAGTRMGHMHLQVGDIPTAEAFYHGVLGFDIVAKMPSALFVSAGGYHHHIGMNTWHSRGAGPAPAGTAGLRFFSLEMASAAARTAVRARISAAGMEATEAGEVLVVRDPWRNTLLLGVGAAESALAATTLAEAWRAAGGA
jgi:catechol 2,3-dioxygenase